MSEMSLLEAWSNWEPASPPFVLPDDLKVLNSQQSARGIITLHS